MLLKLDLYLHHSSPVSDKVFMEEALAGLFPRSATFDVPAFTGCASPTFEDSGICPHFWDHYTLERGGVFFLPFSFFASTIMGCPPYSGSPPTGRAGGLPSDLGAGPSGLSQYLFAAKTQQMHHTQAGLTISRTNV